MPRDLRLESEATTLEALPPLSKEPDANSPAADDSPLPLYKIPTNFLEERFTRMQDLHPYSGLLSQDSLDECDWLEHLAFEPHEAASREKLEYRLHVCGELCSGIFTSAYSTTSGPIGSLIRSREFPMPDAHDTDRKQVMLGHVIATKHSSHTVTDASMDYPKDWRQNYQFQPKDGTGHDELGETVCLHSLCVHPDFQHKGLGMVLLKHYVQRIKDSGVAARIALLCREKLVPWYEKAGFRKVGESKCAYGGGGWWDMVLEFDDDGMDEDNY